MRTVLVLGLFLATACAADGNDIGEAIQALAPAGYELVSGETALDTLPDKQLTVDCPRDKVALGAGWAVLDDTNAILPGKATYFAPHYAGTSWLTGAQYVGGWATTWKLVVTVVCASPPEGYEVVFDQTAVDDVSTKQVEASCGKGRVTLGAGWEVLDPTAAILEGEATYFMAAFDASGWLINARNDSGGKWFLRTRLICASGAAVPSLEVVTDTSDLDALSFKQLSGECPKGKVVTSGGWGALDDTDIIMEGAPRYSLPGWTATTWMTNAEVAGGEEWKLRVRTLCL